MDRALGSVIGLRDEVRGTLAADLEMLDLADPTTDFVKLAGGFGIPAWRATTGEEFCESFERALAEPGPSLVEAVIPGIL